jgi:polysaccharide biosynthesis transport protein
MAQINNSLKSFQSRIEGVPMSEKEYQELLGNRDIARSKFLDLDSKKTKSNLADEMEKRKFGENLEVLDVASLPMTPTSPRREMVISVGTLAGLVLGLLLAGAREMKDTSLKNLKDVRAYTQLPILGSIPLLENDLVVKRRRRISWLGWSIAGLAGIVIMSGSVVYYFVTKN